MTGPDKKQKIMVGGLISVVTVSVAAVALFSGIQSALTSLNFNEPARSNVEYLTLSVAEEDLLAQYSVGDIFSVELKTGDIENEEISVSEAVLEFDPATLKGGKISTPDETFLSLNKAVDNEKGIVTTDLAFIGSGSFESDSLLLSVEFEVLNASSSAAVITVSRDATLGIPDILQTSKLSVLTLNLK